MANTVGDITDPEGTLRPDEPILATATAQFMPVQMDNRSQKICLPRHIQPKDAYGIFSLFFSDDVLAMIVQNTNDYAPIHQAKLQADNPSPKFPRLPWKDTSVAELRAYLGFLIYRSVHSEADRSDYWTTDPEMAIHRCVFDAMGRNRFDQLEACIHVAKKEPAEPLKGKKKTRKKKISCFDKVSMCLYLEF